MARPRKDGRLKMDSDIRIPLTSEQKALIVQATANEPEGMAAWARAILLTTARERVGDEGPARVGASGASPKKGKRKRASSAP
jgi:hypothetical protein